MTCPFGFGELKPADCPDTSEVPHPIEIGEDGFPKGDPNAGWTVLPDGSLAISMWDLIAKAESMEKLV